MISRLVSLATRFIPRHYLQLFASLLLKTLGLFYRGNRYQDPIDGVKYRKLLPYGRLTVRKNALAPNSMSLERHRLIWLYLQRKTDFFTAPRKVLHVAPEYCFIKPIRRLKNIEYTTADLISPWADVKLDVQAMPFADNTFDIVICNHVLEHVDNDRQAMTEIRRVLKPGGFAILQVPMDLSMEETLENPEYNTPELREKYFQQRDHLRLYGRDYAQRLASSGFDVMEDDFVKQLPPQEVAYYALPKDEILHIAHKR